MIFEPLELGGACLIRLQPSRDNRGHFARTFCVSEFSRGGIESCFSQHSASYTRAAGTIRGLHYQRSPNLEAKVVRCVRGAIYDVIVDLRRRSPTFARWTSVELSEHGDSQLYIPRGFAHGFQSLLPDTELHYMISTPYVADGAAGIRYDDATFSITWPLAVTEMSDRDHNLPAFDGTPID